MVFTHFGNCKDVTYFGNSNLLPIVGTTKVFYFLFIYFYLFWLYCQPFFITFPSNSFPFFLISHDSPHTIITHGLSLSCQPTVGTEPSSNSDLYPCYQCFLTKHSDDKLLIPSPSLRLPGVSREFSRIMQLSDCVLGIADISQLYKDIRHTPGKRHPCLLLSAL